MVAKQEPRKLELEINKPIGVELTQVAVNSDNGYGHSVSIKGTLSDGSAVTGFLKGAVWAVLKGLGEARVIEAKKWDEAPDTRYTIPVDATFARVILERRQGASDKHANLVITPQSAIDRLAEKPVAQEEVEVVAEIKKQAERDPLAAATRFLALYAEVLEAGIRLHKSIEGAGEFTSDTAYKVTFTAYKS